MRLVSVRVRRTRANAKMEVDVSGRNDAKETIGLNNGNGILSRNVVQVDYLLQGFV